MRHNKLVRDKIPAEIEARGAKCVTATFTGLALYDGLREKLIEEAWEVRKALTREQLVEELADVQAVLDHIAAYMQIGSLELNAAVCRKQRTKGDFSDGVYLISSTEPGGEVANAGL